MRLRQLDLTRFGKFADTALDFGSAQRDCDVTVLYGDNEAGKSTIFAAWLALLYGLPMQTPYAFRFARKDMQIGATLEVDGGILSLCRTGAREGSLTDDQGRVIADHRMSEVMHGLDEKAYRTRFSLDDAELRDGGDEIARAQGDLGRLLHAGASGMSGLSDTLAGIETEVDAFHKKGGRKTTLREAVNTLKELEKDIRAARLSPMDFDGLRKAAMQAEMDHTTAQEAWAEARRAFALHEAAQRRSELSEQLAQVSIALAETPEGPNLAPDAETVVAAAQERIRRAETDLTRAKDAISAAENALTALDPDPEGQQLGALLATLDAVVWDDGTPLLTRAVTAQADLGKRESEDRALADQMAVLAQRLSVSTDTVPAAEALDQLRSRAMAARDAQRSVQDAQARLTQTRQTLGPEITEPTALAALEDAVAALTRFADDPEALTREAMARAADARQQAIGLPDGWQALITQGLPEEAELADLVARCESVGAKVTSAHSALVEADEALALARDKAQAAQGGSVVLDSDIADSRAARDQAWTAHRADFAPASADLFEAAMRVDDDVRARHALNTEDRIRLARLSEDVAQAMALCARRRAAFETAEAEQQSWRDKANAMADALGVDRDALGALRPRLLRLIKAQEAALLSDAAVQKAHEATARQTALRTGVLKVLASVGVDVAPERAAAEAERCLTRLREQAKSAAVYASKARELARLEADVGVAQAEDAAAQQDLADAVSGGWGTGLTPSDILAQLSDMQRLAGILNDRAQLAHRITAMQQALDLFEQHAAPLRAAVGENLSVAETIAAARTRAAQAAELDDALERHQQALDKAKAQQAESTRAMDAAKATIAQVLDGQAQTTGDAVSLVRTLAIRDRNRSKAEDLEAAIVAAGRGFDPDDLARESAQQDPMRHDTLGDAVTRADQARTQAAELLGAARADLRNKMNSAGGVRLDQKRATVLETLRDEAREAMALHLGLMAANGALRRFREDRRGEMLEATQAAFATLTEGEWQRLETRTMGKMEKLVAMRDGEPVSADAMSTGTRGQLYLALRIAGHAGFVRDHGPLPFVTDDILETFDDGRAGAALRLARDMGTRGQVLMLTHHRHLVDMARDQIPDVRVIDLNAL